MLDKENFEGALNDERLDEVSAGAGIDARLSKETKFDRELPEVGVTCPVCGKVTRKKMMICNCPSHLWGSDMCFASLCKDCEEKNRKGILEKEIEFKDVGNGEKWIVGWKGNH